LANEIPWYWKIYRYSTSGTEGNSEYFPPNHFTHTLW